MATATILQFRPRNWTPLEHLNHLLTYYGDGATRVIVKTDDNPVVIYAGVPGDELAPLDGHRITVTIVGSPEYPHSLFPETSTGKEIVLRRDPLISLRITKRAA